MNFSEELATLSARAKKQMDHIKHEEATKTALIMPFMEALGYDVFNPLEVVPEFTADIGIKKGENVDFAIKRDERIAILIECKWCDYDLDDAHASQMRRYFSATDARFAVLTNGLEYRFYSDIDKPNIMDVKPFFSFNVLNYEERQIEKLKMFSASTFDTEDILTLAGRMKYIDEVKRRFAEELKEPSDRFVKFVLPWIYKGMKTRSAIDRFAPTVKDALNQFINDKVRSKLQSALDANQEVEAGVQEETGPKQHIAGDDGIETTEDELEGFNIVRAIVREVVDVSRVHHRDTKSYMGILLDDNNRKPICRLHFNRDQKYIELMGEEDRKREPIEVLEDIFNYSDELKRTALKYHS